MYLVMSGNTATVNQGVLWKQIKLLFPNTEIHVNSRKSSSIPSPPLSSSPSSPSFPLSSPPSSSPSTYLELDIWLPQYQLGLEFQDSYHYISTWFNQLPLENIQHIDNIKRVLAHQKQIDLVNVPCWWDGSCERLIGTLQFQRPDLISHFDSSVPIPLNPSPDFFKNPEIPDVGELMLASFPAATLIASFTSKWWFGEKYDGIRCCWNPIQKKLYQSIFALSLYSRKARELVLNDSLLRNLPPNHFFDGELWFGRGQFGSTYSLLHGSLDQVPWHLFRLVGFDDPEEGHQSHPFETRYASLLSSFKKDHPFLSVAPRFHFLEAKSTKGANNNLEESEKSKEERIRALLETLIAQEGEGMVLRQSRSPYVPGRSSFLFKLKSAQGDQEGIVVGLFNDKSVLLKLVDGNTIKVPAEDVRVREIRVGDVVTFTHESYSRRSLPVNPLIIRIRSDISWEDVIFNYFNDHKFKQEEGYSAQPLRYWTDNNIRLFLESFARERGLDPLSPDTWYSISSNDVRNSKGGSVILDKFQGYFNTLRKVFPDIGLDKNLFNIRARWQSVSNRRQFFEEYARECNFDPQIPRNWYLQPREKIMATQGARGVICYHNNNLANALFDLFPNIGFEKDKLVSSKSVWSLQRNRRKLFERYAKEHHFDPLVPDNWYHQSRASLLSFKGVRRALVYHGYSLSKALIELFPDISLEKEKLKVHKANWQESKTRRLFLEKVAKKRGLDPLNPAHWYSIKSDDLIQIKGIRRIMSYHGHSIYKTLNDLFPDVNFDKKRLPAYKNEWNNADNRRMFFDQFAKEKGFSSLNAHHWYNISKKSLLAVKGAQRILQYHNNSMADALVDLYPDVNFDKSKFSRNTMKSKENRKAVFESFAKEHDFDPNNAEKWNEHIKTRKILSKDILVVISYYKHRIRDAIEDLFPGVKLSNK